jgi:hypothetical protein
MGSGAVPDGLRILRKCAKLSQLRDPHRSATVATPWQHRSSTVAMRSASRNQPFSPVQNNPLFPGGLEAKFCFADA